jgi:hypothetical protein
MQTSTILPALLFAVLTGPAARASDLVLEKGPQIQSPIGYSVRWPELFTGLRDERDDGSETIVTYPKDKKVAFADMGDLAKIKSSGMIILNAHPRAGQDLSLEDFAARSRGAFKKMGRESTAESAACALGRAVVVRVQGRPDYVTVLAVGKNASYEFIAGSYGPALKGMLQSLKEVPPDPDYGRKQQAARALTARLDANERQALEKRTGQKTSLPKRVPAGFTGRYGTFFPCAEAVQATSRFADDDPSIEVIQFFDKGTPAAALQDVKRFSQYGVVTVEVIPRLKKEVDLLAEVRQEFPGMLSRQGLKFTRKAISSPMPGEAFYISQPFKLARVFLQSDSTVYKFISGVEAGALQGLIDGMKPAH